MKMIEFTAFHEGDHAKVSHIRFVVADHSDPTKQTEWIDAKIAIDEPTVRSGVIQRTKALEKVRDELDRLIADFRSDSDQARQESIGRHL